MSKQDTYPSKTNLVGADYVTGVDSTGPFTIRMLLSSILSFVWGLANIPAGATSPITRDNESQFAFVASGLKWTADNPGSTKNASMTAGVIYINGRRISIGAVSGRTFTASDDTYVDVLDNGDGTGTLVYTLVANNATSPSLAANSVRIAIVCTGATNISANSQINQGDPQVAAAPTISSQLIAVSDSIGNLIYPTSQQKTVAFMEIAGNPTGGASSVVTDITGATVSFIADGIHDYMITGKANLYNSTTGNNTELRVRDTSNNVIADCRCDQSLNTSQTSFAINLQKPSAGAHTYKISFYSGGTSNSLVEGNAVPTQLYVQLA